MKLFNEKPIFLLYPNLLIAKHLPGLSPRGPQEDSRMQAGKKKE